jgi:hypothetical protein
MDVLDVSRRPGLWEPMIDLGALVQELERRNVDWSAVHERSLERWRRRRQADGHPMQPEALVAKQPRERRHGACLQGALEYRKGEAIDLDDHEPPSGGLVSHRDFPASRSADPAQHYQRAASTGTGSAAWHIRSTASGRESWVSAPSPTAASRASAA